VGRPGARRTARLPAFVLGPLGASALGLPDTLPRHTPPDLRSCRAGHVQARALLIRCVEHWSFPHCGDEASDQARGGSSWVWACCRLSLCLSAGPFLGGGRAVLLGRAVGAALLPYICLPYVCRGVNPALRGSLWCGSGVHSRAGYSAVGSLARGRCGQRRRLVRARLPGGSRSSPTCSPWHVPRSRLWVGAAPGATGRRVRPRAGLGLALRLPGLVFRDGGCCPGFIASPRGSTHHRRSQPCQVAGGGGESDLAVGNDVLGCRITDHSRDPLGALRCAGPVETRCVFGDRSGRKHCTGRDAMEPWFPLCEYG
jgi:hypothetical protein